MIVTAQELATLCDIAEAAGREIMVVYASGGEVWQKEDASPLTEADLRADNVIRAGLESHFPGIFIWSEESVSSPPAQAQTFFWWTHSMGRKSF